MFRQHREPPPPPAQAGRRRLLRCEGASISPMFALLLVPLAGSIAYAVELGGMQYVQRSAQNAADAAALAAATNNSTTGTTYLMEARGAARPFGYVDGTGNVTVTAAPVTCPAGTPGTSPVCYEAVITTSFPLTFSRVIGFTGTGGSGSQTIAARAVATAAGTLGGLSSSACLWALGSSGVTLSGDGIPSADLTGCGVMSAGGINCNGSGTMKADYALSGTGPSSGCALTSAGDLDPTDTNWAPLPADPFASLTPPSTAACGDNPGENSLSGTLSGTSLNYCGNVKLTGNVDLTGTGTVMVIKNGALDLNGFTLKTSGTNASTTIIFTGSNTSDRQHYPMSSKAKSGTLEIKAPTTGTWANIAMYQDRTLTNRTYNPGNKDTVNFEYAGNEPTWNVAGVAYFPKASTTFKGAIGKYGTMSCFQLIANTIAISGTGLTIADNTTADCSSGGYTIPGATLPGAAIRTRLVL